MSTTTTTIVVHHDAEDEDNQSAGSEADEIATREPDAEQSKTDAKHAAFAKFLESEAGLDSTTEIAAKIAARKVAAESARIIDRARDYQQELFERAKDENVIAVLDTGSGKTLISCLLMKHMLTQELMDRSNGKRPRIIFFLANSVHLVLQQAQVLNSNLLTESKVFVGSNKAEEWKKPEFWLAFVNENTPVVCTPAILQQSLDSGGIGIDQISLLVFDEAHHAKKNHPYSKIIRSYYLQCPPQDRPRIFGMTASPVDSKGNIDTNAADLEQLLHSKIITTSDMSILSFAPKPRDLIWKYPRPVVSFETDLYRRLWVKCHFATETKKGFEFAKRAVTELGSWCADRVWRHVFGHTEYESTNILKRYEQSKPYLQLGSAADRETALQLLQEAISIVLQYDHEMPSTGMSHLSPKVSRLYTELQSRFSDNPDTRAIVFVDQRLTAHVLHDCFLYLGIPNVRPGILLGSATESTSMKKQEQVLETFRAGLVNLVFATSVADEGIDIPQCNLCIRFDLYKTPIQYMQSRGRARLEGSTYVHMVQEDDQNQTYMVKYAMESDKYIKDFCQNLPPDRLLGKGTKLQKLIAQDCINGSFKTSVGAVCDFGNALIILSRFVTSLHYVGAVDKEIYEEEIDLEEKQFRYVVRLPPNEETQIRGARGEWRQNKQLAKRSAAFNCCYLLRHRGMLNHSLYSIFQKVKPENLNARLAVTDTSSSYPMLIKPSMWSQGLGAAPTELWASILRFSPEKNLRRPLKPIVLLTRRRLPELPAFPVFLEDNIRVSISITRLEQSLRISPDDLQALTVFTLDGVFGDVFNKTYEKDPCNMAYWLAPLVDSCSLHTTSLKNIACMQSIQAVGLGRVRWSKEAQVDGVWTDKFICDPRNGKYHYFSGNVLPGISIFDPVPDSVPPISQKSRNNIIDFSDSFWKASKKNFAAATYDPKQPVISADLVITRRNFLEPSAKESEYIACQIAPQPLEVSRLNTGFAVSCFILPAILHRIESYLIALEAFEKLDLSGMTAGLALEAVTKGNDNADDHESQMHSSGRRGMGKNYERLEFIGDSLLKMTTTIAIYNKTKCDEEGMHCRRMAILCNRRLFDVSTEKHQLYRYVRSSGFNRVTWYPENLVLLAGRGAKKPPEPIRHPDIKQSLGMKTIADVSEAIIGAAICATRHSPKPLDLGIKAITILVDSEDHTIKSWAEICSMYKAAEWSLQTNDVQANKLAADVESRTGYKFEHPRLLRSAFTHSSDQNATVPDLQRLEFLGDAVLDWVSISWLFYANPDRNPQWLTEHKMAMVSNKFLAALAVKLDFDKFLYCSTAKLYADITHYASQVRQVLSQENVPRDFWTQFESPPKALSDLVESYIGAVLVDSNWNLQEIEAFFTKHVLWFFEDITLYDSFANRHPTSFLHKKFQDEFKCNEVDVMNSTPQLGVENPKIVAGVVVHGRVIAQSMGTSARYAKVRASKKALELVDGMTSEEFRRKHGCNCRSKEGMS